MSYAIVWEFLVPEDQTASFEAAYGPDGPWSQLFARAPGFLEVRLLRSHDRAGRYLTIDRWQSVNAFENFKRHFAKEYQELDRQLEGLASSEVPLGAFDDMPETGGDSC
ncbi:antibiotic biosynthesis monooxygenase family protein [Dyella kyungheensis]|uniref:antibiotic biosynthesis monooxygenase family protein n=1 Tax=Dyella kyungheensis TaxID=1242174 RepID=UPI003CF0A9A3